jgi:hypothetical protein
MYSFRSKHEIPAHPGYATCSDLCDNLVSDLQHLSVLAFLLTGSHAEAEKCFVTTLDDVVTAKGVFKGWEHSWNKRCLIINAIRHVFRGPVANRVKREDAYESDVNSGHCAIDSVARLAPPLPRFVFVISVLERYSEHECALLLGRPQRDIREARIHAFWQLSGVTATSQQFAG